MTQYIPPSTSGHEGFLQGLTQTSLGVRYAKMWLMKVSDFLELQGTLPMHQELQKRGLLVSKLQVRLTMPLAG